MVFFIGLDWLQNTANQEDCKSKLWSFSARSGVGVPGICVKHCVDVSIGVGCASLGWAAPSFLVLFRQGRCLMGGNLVWRVREDLGVYLDAVL